jgi:hypothetical protein
MSSGSPEQFDFAYEISEGEVKLASAQALSHGASRYLKATMVVTNISVQLGQIVLGFGFVLLLFVVVGLSVREYSIIWLVLGAVVARALEMMRSEIFRHAAKSYVRSKMMQDQRLRIYSQGIETNNGRSQSLNAWEDCEAIISKEGVTVFLFGIGHYIAVPERLLGPPDSIGNVKAQIELWRKAKSS